MQNVEGMFFFGRGLDCRFGSRPQGLRVRGLEVSALGVEIQVLDIDKGWRQNQRVHVGI